ncbi:hypothetical protein [Rhodopila sp.]|uniref:hypothetical protein n=1 Tax=Rhodopila sp. TaxID=2480087 RepID=UPI003D10AABF
MRPPGMRLGRLPHDPAALAAAPRHRFGAVPPPAVLDRSALAFTPGLYSNDTLPDCTAVALANAARGVAELQGYDLVVEADRVPRFYAWCIGNPPNLAATDGANMLDVLTLQQSYGFFIGPQLLVGRFGSIDVASRSALAAGLARLGPGYWGVTLRERDMQRAPIWDVRPGRDDGAVVGGHALIAWDYTGLADEATVRLGTWGGWQPATWSWIAARLEEAHGVVWRQLVRADGTFYDGLTADDLVAEVEA